MSEQNNQFYNKLYAIQPFTQTISPRSSSHEDNPQEDTPPPQIIASTPLPPFTVTEPIHFLEDIASLRKINSEQPAHDPHIGESNRKTMTSISSTIDILFSKIQRIKEQFSFALQKPHSQTEALSDWHHEGPSDSKSQSSNNKENQVLPDKMVHSKSKPVQTVEHYEVYKPLEIRNYNEHQKIHNYSQQVRSESYHHSSVQNHNFPKIELVQSLNIFQPWADEPAGLQIRDFQLGKCVGSGKFGDVFMSQHKATGFVCAIKKILKSTIIEYNMVDQFANELRIHYSLDHPNVVKLFSHFQDEYHIFLLLQIASQGSLIQQLVMPEQETKNIIDQVTDALVYIHRKKIIHRDIKPQNIVMAMGVPKLCDFGWAAINQSTMHQTFCGTLDYVSPEMKDLGEYNDSIDLWSIGVLTFQLLVGFPPFKQEISNWKLKGSKRKIKWNWDVLYPPQIGDEARRFIESLLNVDPIERASLVQCKSNPFLMNNRTEEQSQQYPQLQTLFQ